MGRKWRRNRKNKHTGEGKDRDRKTGDPSKYGQERDPYKMIEGGNYKMEAFYAYQGMHDYYLDTESGTFKKCTTNEQKEEERKRWSTALKSMLPASFRIGTDVHEGLRNRLEKELGFEFEYSAEQTLNELGRQFQRLYRNQRLAET